MKQSGHESAPAHLAVGAVRSPAAAEGALGQGDVLDDLGEVQVDLQQQILAPLAHGAENRGGACGSTSDS